MLIKCQRLVGLTFNRTKNPTLKFNSSLSIPVNRPYLGGTVPILDPCLSVPINLGVDVLILRISTEISYFLIKLSTLNMGPTLFARMLYI